MTTAEHESPPESTRERLGRLFKNTSIYAIGEAGVKILGALLVPILALFLPPSQLGLWSLALMVYTGFMNLCNPALHGAVTRFYFDHEHEPAAQKRFQGTVLSFLLIWSFALCVIATATGKPVFAALFEDFAFWPYGALVVWMVFLGVLGVVPRAIWVAAEKSKPVIGINLLGNAVYAVGAVALVALTGLGVLGLFLARTASLAVLAVPLLIYSLRHVGLAWSWDDLRSALRFSLPLVPHLLAHWVLGMSDRLIIERHYANLDPATLVDQGIGVAPDESLALHAVGIYSTAYVFTELVIMVGASMNSAWVPQFNRAHGRPEERGYVARSITYFMLAVGAMSAGLVVLSPTVVRLFLPAKYAFAAGIAPILAFGGLFQGLYYVYVAVLFYNKDNRLLPFITVLSGAVNVALNLLWLPSYGLAGAAWATVISYMLLVVGVRWAAMRFSMPEFESGKLLRIAAVLTLVAIAGLVLDDRLPLIWEAAAKLALLGAGAAALWLLGAFASREPTTP